jgi:predicted MFS family arabinose efflux permease
MSTFLTVWFGQLISLTGSALTYFALNVWVYDETGSVTLYALIAAFFAIPGIVIAPFAGVVVDRFDRRKIMLVADTASALSSLMVAILLATDSLEIWHIYIVSFVNATGYAFQTPAYMATTSLLVPKKHYARASGLVDLAEAVGYIIAPIAAGTLIIEIGLSGVLLIDVVTFLFALVTLLIVRFPRPEASLEGEQSKGSVLQEALFGWSYIRARRGLSALLALSVTFNSVYRITTLLVIPLVLSFATPDVLGVIGSVSSVGFLAGGIVMSVWGGPKRLINGVFLFGVFSALTTMLAGTWPAPANVVVGMIGFLFCLVGINACNRAIWQSTVEPDIQGRVFSIQSMISRSTVPVASLLTGPLADYIFEPLMAEGGALAGSVGNLIGVGEGRGIGLMFVVMGMLMLIVLVVGFLYKPLRLVGEAARQQSNIAQN